MEEGGGNGRRRNEGADAKINYSPFPRRREISAKRKHSGNGMLDSFTPRRLRGGVRARSRSRGVEYFLGLAAVRHPPKIRFANFYPPPQAAEGEIPAYAGMERLGSGGG